MHITGDANINFIEDLAFTQDYAFVEDKQWLLKKEVLVVNLAPNETKTKETTGFIGRKTTFYSNYIIDQPKEEQFYRKGEEIEMTSGLYNHPLTYWDSARGETLAQREKKIYHMIDTLQTLPAYKFWSDLGYLAATGYKVTGWFEIGSIYSFLSGNQIEGYRLRFGGQTSNKFSTRLKIGRAHV